MNRMERHEAIMNILQDEHSAGVSDLAAKFNVSEMTIRRDLSDLSQQYNITRTHGGAVIQNAIVHETSFVEAKISHQEEKSRIAQKAVGMIENGQRIFIDAGSTARIMMNYFTDNMRNIIVTNHIKVAERTEEYQHLKTILLGGEMLKGSNCTYGPTVIEQLSKYRLDIAFLGAAAVGSDGKLYDGYSLEADFKKIIFDISDKVVLLVDSSKFNTYDLRSYGALDMIDELITDDRLDKSGRELLQHYHVHSIIV